MAGSADPIVTADSGNTWLEGILWGTQWSSGASPTTISVYIGGLHGSETIELDGQSVTATTPYTEELQAMLAAMEAIEAVCNVKFVNVSSQAGADIIWASVNDVDADGALGWANPPGTAFSTTFNDEQSVIVANYESYDPAYPDPNLLVPGGFDFITFIHELGHAVGLAHPHDTGGGSTIFPGVSGPFGDFGDFNMNQGIFTMMSYNDGWQTGPLGLPPSTTYGYEMTPMALDIAALQFLYGANASAHSGDDIYALPTSNTAGVGYSCIWDAGGTDRVVGGDGGNIIDLRAATLLVAVGGGGFVSSASGIHGGITIANGVVIENATGGRSADTIRGNTAGNDLVGLGGNDRLLGLSGNDDIQGNVGNDTIEGGVGNDTLIGGLGTDVMLGGTGNDFYTVDAAGEADETAGGGSDTVRSTVSYSLGADLENLTLVGSGNTNATGNELDNRIVGNAGANRITGALGRDVMTGGGASDIFDFNSTDESAVLATARDVITDFDAATNVTTVDRIDLSTIDANVNLGNDQAFIFGGAFTAGHIRAIQSGVNVVLQFNTDADADAEMSILLQNVTATNLNSGDFVL